MAEYIYEIKNNLHPDVCKHIIEKYEQDHGKFDGKIGGSSGGYVDKSIKNSTDLRIDPNCKNWKDIDDYLFQRLSDGFNSYKEYVKNYMKNSTKNFPNNDSNCNLINDKIINIHHDTGYQIQRIDKNGFYIWHSDYYPKRQVAYIWYLNTLNPENDGGTTDFLTYNKKIIPEEGKLIFFPSIWTYPHSGSKVISDNSKYIITGFMLHD